MKTMYSREYYESNKNRLLEKYGCDYENEVRLFIPNFNALPEEERKKAEAVAKQIAVKKVIATAEEDLRKTMEAIREIKAGRASLGYISKPQEIREWAEMQERFEFSCYMLAELKRKYNI